MALTEIVALLRTKSKIIYPVTQLKNITDDSEDLTAPADADSVPLVDASDSGQMKKITWARIKTALSSVFAAKSHTHENYEYISYTSNTLLVHTDPEFSNGVNGLGAYNNSANSNVTLTRVAAPTGTPTKSGYVMQIKTVGTASPGIGGFVQSIKGRANATFLIRYLMKIPVGYTVCNASNSMGSGYTDQWLTDREGTGNWKWYVRKVQCGATGSFSAGGHVYLSGNAATSANPVIWYVAAVYCYDITQAEDTVIKALSISGKVITYTRSDGTTGTLTTQDTNTTYTLASFGITATAAELNHLDGITATVSELNKLHGLTATTAELNKLDGVTATAAELNYVDGVTSNIQTQLNNKAAKTAATQSAAGLMSAADKKKLDGLSGDEVPVYIQESEPSENCCIWIKPK